MTTSWTPLLPHTSTYPPARTLPPRAARPVRPGFRPASAPRAPLAGEGYSAAAAGARADFHADGMSEAMSALATPRASRGRTLPRYSTGLMSSRLHVAHTE